MKLKYIIFAAVLSFHASNSFSGVLQAASSFLSLYDSVVDKIHTDSEKYEDFLASCKRTGIYERVEVVRMMHSTLLSKEQPAPIEPIKIYVKKVSRLPVVGETPEVFNYEMGALGLAGPVASIFQGFKEDENLEGKLKELMLELLNILDKDSAFTNICSELNLLEKHQNTIETISELAKT